MRVLKSRKRVNGLHTSDPQIIRSRLPTATAAGTPALTDLQEIVLNTALPTSAAKLIYKQTVRVSLLLLTVYNNQWLFNC